MNRVVLTGRLTRDPELRTSQSGTSFVTFSIAVNRPFSSNNGEREVDFFNCVAFGKLAENVNRFVQKGRLVGVDGRIQTRNYTAQDGSKRTQIDIVCESVEFLEPKSSGTSERSPGGYYDYNQLDEPNVNVEKPRRPSHQGFSPYDDQFSRPSESRQKQSNQSIDDEYDDMKNDFGVSDDDLPF